MNRNTTPETLPASNGHAPPTTGSATTGSNTRGTMTLRRTGRMHHLGIGTTRARKRVLALTNDHTITGIELDTGEVLSTHDIDPTKIYWRNKQREPGRWPSFQK
jgi:hypothetical protein